MKKQIRRDETAVSPVVGVILMVGVTVVLAATIGGFVFGMSNTLNSPTPSTQIATDYSDGSSTLTITHDGGEALKSSNTGILKIKGASSSDINWETSKSYLSSGSSGDEAVVEGPIGADNAIATVDNVGSGDTIKLIWESPNGDKSSIIESFTAP